MIQGEAVMRHILEEAPEAHMYASEQRYVLDNYFVQDFISNRRLSMCHESYAINQTVVIIATVVVDIARKWIL